MLSLFGRQFWMIRLLGVATASALAGSAASSALALVIVDRAASAFETTDTADEVDEEDEEPEVLAKAGVKPKPAVRGAFGRQAASATLDAYNPFCPTCEPETKSPVMLAQGGSTPVPGAATVATKLPLRLHVTMEAERPADSLATIYDVERNVVGVYGVGDTLREGVTVLAVSYAKVELRTPTGAEFLELGKPVVEPKAEPKAEEKAKPEPKTKPMAESPDLDAIQCATADVCTVEREFVDEILANPAKFVSQAPRVAPLPDGGFKLAGVRKGSLAHKLGLANGDILLAVNGSELKGLDDALGLMTKLRRASNLEVTLDRKGTSVRKQIEIK